MKKITMLLAMSPVAFWPSITQLLISAFFVILTYGIEKLIIYIKYRIDLGLAVLPEESSESL